MMDPLQVDYVLVFLFYVLYPGQGVDLNCDAPCWWMWERMMIETVVEWSR